MIKNLIIVFLGVFLSFSLQGQTLPQKAKDGAKKLKKEIKKAQDKHEHTHDHGQGEHSHDHSHDNTVKESHSHSKDGHDHSHSGGHSHEGHDHKGHDHSTHDHNGSGAHAHDQSQKGHSNRKDKKQKGGSHAAGDHKDHGDHHGASCNDHSSGHHGEFDPGAVAFHHISDANVYSIGPWCIPLPCMLYSKEQGFDFFSSSKFNFESLGHGNGHQAYNRYVLDAGRVKRVKDGNFPMGEVQVDGVVHDHEGNAYACYQSKMWNLDAPSTADGGLFGGGITSFYDLSITKNVMSMFIVFGLLAFLFIRMAKSYLVNKGQAPKGLVTNFLETIFLFIQEEVSKPFLGAKYMKFQPFLMCLFFFVLGLNLWGQIPFFGGSNVSGNLAVTMVLAIFAFLVTNLNGNKHYWEHIFAMPGLPKWVLTILTPVEFLGVFIKPITLMLRLFANITAGHMVVIIFVSLIFVFSKNGASAVGGYGTVIPSTLLTIFMMAIELLVAFIQAFVFTILTASYIGAAVEEPHH